VFHWLTTRTLQVNAETAGLLLVVLDVEIPAQAWLERELVLKPEVNAKDGTAIHSANKHPINLSKRDIMRTPYHLTLM
jgi:hypothetical protein